MPTFHLHKYLLWFIASIWLINGLWCKVLGMVPRHEWIVARFTGAEIAPWLTKAIGAGEMLMAIWVLRKVWPKTCAWLQIGLVATMNTLEFFWAPDLLLWGRWNALFALGFIALVWFSALYNPSASNKRFTHA